jgi:putative metallohydrolase (TIGR04338 family)
VSERVVRARPPRDAQRSRVYRAETPLPGRQFRELERCGAFADSVVGSLWWQARFPHLGLGDVPRLRPGHGARQAFYRVDPDGPTITLPRRYRTSAVILHELAHWALDDQPDLPNHGRTFARLLLDATLEFGGDARADTLRVAFDEQRVRIGAPPRLGPDGRWRYGWDERLRLGRERVLTLHRYDDDAVTGTYCGAERAGSVLVVRSGPTLTRVRRRDVWDVVPA